MKKPLIFALVFSLICAAAWIWRVQSYQQSRKTLKFAYQGTPEDARHQSALRFKSIIESEPGNTLRVELYYGGQLGGDRDAIEGLQLGTIEMTAAGAGIFANFEPKMGITALPYLFETFEDAWAYCDNDAYRQVTALLLRRGLRVLGQWDNGFRCVTNSIRPIHTPEDLEGLKYGRLKIPSLYRR